MQEFFKTLDRIILFSNYIGSIGIIMLICQLEN